METVWRICILILGCKGLMDTPMRRYHCILTGSCMLLDTFVYSLPFTFALQLNAWKRLLCYQRKFVRAKGLGRYLFYAGAN